MSETFETDVERYHYSVAWSEEDKLFIARVAEWESLAAHGRNTKEALEEIKQVVRFAIESCKEDGDPYPEPHDV